MIDLDLLQRRHPCRSLSMLSPASWSRKDEIHPGDSGRPRFNDGTRTLLLVMEEGEEEYHADTYPHNCVYQEVVDDLDELTAEALEAMVKKYHARRVVAELNGMRLAGEFYEKMPEDWQIAQEVMFADSTTILSYNANMRQLVVDKLTGAEMVVFNRMAPGADVMPFHKLARAVNRRIDIVYDFVDGSTQFDEIEDPLPFDINAPVIEIKDEDYALFYRDITEEPKKYDKKTVRFKGRWPSSSGKRWACSPPAAL